MNYRFSRYEDDCIKKYEFSSYDEVKTWIDQEIDKFKKTNRVENELSDRSFINFKSEMEKIITYAEAR